MLFSINSELKVLPVALLIGCIGPILSADEASEFEKHIRPIFKAQCYSCHGSKTKEAGLRLDVRSDALSGGDSGPVLISGKPNDSELLKRVTSADSDIRMPPEGERLSHAEIASLRTWIQEGAHWPEGIDQTDFAVEHHWAFQPISLPHLPTVHEAWGSNPIDLFIQRKLEQEHVPPSAEADRSTLIRRVFLDLTGLPPSPIAWKRWTNDQSDEWYERLVDMLLASPHYGERWGRFWLDQARYADSDGYEKDSPRPNAYLWRDWVIDAFNKDLPFDEFTVQQIAGDLLPAATPEVRLATGFHRNTLTNREGGIDKEEDRNKQVVDRINTVASVWLGLTVKCAQCHSHKYDPMTQREYFQLFAFFNNSDEKDFPLSATAQQHREFTSAQRHHRSEVTKLENRLSALKLQASQNLKQLEINILEKYPRGIPTAPETGLLVHLTFDRPEQRLVDLIAKRPSIFSGTGEPKFQTADGRDAIFFNGKNQRLIVENDFTCQSDSPFTLSAWIRPETGSGGIITKLDESADFRGMDFTIHNGILEVHLVDTWPRNAIKVTTKNKVSYQEWHHVLACYDGSKKASGVRIFVDGKKQELQVHYDQLSGSIKIDEPIRIGSRKHGTYFKGAMDDVLIYDRSLSERDIQILAGDARLSEFVQVAKIPVQDRSDTQQKGQLEYSLLRLDEAVPTKSRLHQLQSNPPKLQQHTGTGLTQREDIRQTFVHIRGDFLQKGIEVLPATPAFLHDLKARTAFPDRLDFVRWILAEDNPLTKRVIVNRVWQQFFGKGLVESDQDFGSQGSKPTHPELLDWLAVEFSEGNWSIKKLHRLIVSSATYKQSSRIRTDLLERDPYNQWYARQNRLRVEAEVVRDLALASSGLLDSRIEGPSVYPELPPGVIELAFVDVINRGPWKVSSGGDRYRRGLYTFFQRTAPYPMLSLFDAPDSNTACTRRESSNTPIQALTLWNDPVFMHCARQMAARVIRELPHMQETTLQRRFEYSCILCLGMAPNKTEIDSLTRLFTRSLKQFEEQPKLAKELTANAIVPPGSSLAEFAAWTAVSRTLINLDRFITRE